MSATDASFERDVIDRLGRIETKLDNDGKAIYGNGHPGLLDRMVKLEQEIALLKSKDKWCHKWLGWILATALAVAQILLKR